MCKEVEKVLSETAQAVEPEAICTVVMDGTTRESDDFVAILTGDNGDASIFYNTDALTLGMAMKMVSKVFVEAMHNLPEDERNEVTEILGDAFVFDKPQEA